MIRCEIAVGPARNLIRRTRHMAAKAATATAETTESRDETPDGPLLDTLGAGVKKMVARGKDRGYVTYDDLNTALPPDQVSSEQIEDTMSMLSEMGINVIENEEKDDNAAVVEVVQLGVAVGKRAATSVLP